MSLLPTAHAGQSFGARRIDFYTVSGEVSASDDATGRVTDTDSMTHDVRLLDRSNALAPGDTASVLRVQAGPNRRSRPAAIINHSRGTWMRAAPEATSLLARSGVTRGVNWWLSIMVLALVAIAAVWPAIHGFLTEVNANIMAAVPVFDVFAEINAFLPALGGWRMEAALPAGLLDSLASIGFIPMEQLTEWSLAVGAGLVALLAFFGRSWRLVYIPALGALALATGAILASALPTLAVIGGSLAFFMLGGLVNRIRDGGRFNARVARLAEHALRNPPQEGVRSGDSGNAAATGVAASAAIAAATATARGDAPAEDTAEPTGSELDTATEAGGETTTPASEAPSDVQASGEAEAPDQSDLLPAASSDTVEVETVTEVAAPETSGDAAASEHTAEDATQPEAGVEEVATNELPAPLLNADEAVATDDLASTEAEAPDSVADVSLDPAIVAVADDSANEATDRVQESTPEAVIDSPVDVEVDVDPAADETVQSAADQSDEGSTSDAEEVAKATEATETPDSEITPVTGSDDAELDDDLPSLDDVAAAAALNETESNPVDDANGPAADTPAVALDLNDERTMPVAPPPPMPGNEEPQAVETADEAVAAVEALAEPDTIVDAQPDSPVESALDSAPTPITDDPMMEEAGDPMVTATGAGDFAPGAPDIELDRSPAE